MYRIKKYIDDDKRIAIDQKGPFTVVEHRNHVISGPGDLATYNSSKELNLWQQRLICDLGRGGVTLLSYPLNWSAGRYRCVNNACYSLVKSVAGGCYARDYAGDAKLFLYPTWYRPILIDISEWGNRVVVNHSLLMACESSIALEFEIPKWPSTYSLRTEPVAAVRLQGKGIIALNSPCARADFVEVELQDDVVEVVGNYVLAWSDTLKYSLKTYDNASLVRVFEGSGTVWTA